METPLFEHILTMRERGNLPESEYGLPEVKKYPLTDKEHVLKAIQYFGSCPDKQMHILAANINKKIKQFKMNVNVSETNKFYKYYVPYDSTVKENLLVVESVDTTGIEDLVQESSFLLDNTQFNDWYNGRALVSKYLRWVNYIINRENYISEDNLSAKEEIYIIIYDIMNEYLISENMTLSEKVEYVNTIISIFNCCNPIDYKFAYVVLNTIKAYNLERTLDDYKVIDNIIDDYLNNLEEDDRPIQNMKFIEDYDNDTFKSILKGFDRNLPILSKYFSDNKKSYLNQKYIMKVAYIVYDDVHKKLDIFNKEDNVCITKDFNNIAICTLKDLICCPTECDELLDKNNLTINVDEIYLEKLSENSNIVTIELKNTIIPRLPDEIIDIGSNHMISLLLDGDNNACMLIGKHQGKLSKIKIALSEYGTPQIFAVEPIDIGLETVDGEASLTEGLTINPDGSVRFTLKPNKSYIDEYSEVHKLIVENFNNRNYEAVKDNLCFLFTLIATIEREVLYSKKKINEDVRKDALDARALAINDFKTYLKKLQKVDRNFDFTSYYERSNHGKLVVNITPDTIKGIKKLFNIILLG
jgi:hypothetical protein